MSEAHLLAIGILPAWLAGIRVYLTVFGVGLAGALGWIELPQALQVTASPWVIGVSGALAIMVAMGLLFTLGVGWLWRKLFRPTPWRQPG